MNFFLLHFIGTLSCSSLPKAQVFSSELKVINIFRFKKTKNSCSMSFIEVKILDKLGKFFIDLCEPDKHMYT